MSARNRVILASIGALVVVVLGAAYRYVTSGGMMARQARNPIEAAAAR